MDAFKAEGLNVTVSNFRSWSEVTQQTMSERGVFGLGANTVIRAVMGQNAPVRQIAMVSTLLPYNFWSRPGSGIDKFSKVFDALLTLTFRLIVLDEPAAFDHMLHHLGQRK